MGKLVIDGNKVYTVDESCMRKRRLTIERIHEMDAQSHNNDHHQEKNKKKSR